MGCALVACPRGSEFESKKDVATPPSKPETDVQAVKLPAAKTALEIDPKDLAKAHAQIKAMKVRAACNRVMGCHASIELAGLGPAAPRAIIDVLRLERRSDGYWVTKCIDLLGQLGKGEAASFVATLLSDKRNEIRSRAAIALARLADPGTKEAVEVALTKSRDSPDIGFRMALLMALDRIGPFSVARRKKAGSLLPTTQDGLGGLNPLFLMTAAEVAREWPIPEALPALRITATHIGVFVRRQSIRALGRLGDTGAIPVLVGRLKDEVPSVRRATIRALQSITGNRRFSTEPEWLAWCEKTTCRPK